MRQVISRNLTGRYAIIKIFPFIHALKVEVSEKFIDEQKNELTECRWRLATDKDVLDLRIPMTGENNIAKNIINSILSIMTKNELAREVSVSEKLHLSTTVKAIDGTLRVIKEALAKGEVVVIRGFGTFTPVEVAERTARNFKTGKPLVIPAHTSVKLRASKELVKAINEGKEATL